MKTVLLCANLGNGCFDITVEGGKILSILPQGTEAPAKGAKTVDIAGHRLRAGLIDMHSHGCIGYDTMDGDKLPEMAREYARHGVTTWYPTTMTESPARIHAALTQPLPKKGEGAHILGFHVEGPYINKKYKGAQNEAYIKAPDLAAFSRYPMAKIVTVAPESEGSIEFIRKTDALVCIGHTACDLATAKAAFAAGAKCLTHTCNAMPPLLHRAPGPIGAAIEEDGYAQVICDGLHIERAMILALYRVFGVRRTVFISDSMHATGLGDGVYSFGGQRVTVKAGVARTDEGALAGSTTNLFDCVKVAVSFGIPADDAFAMASQTPAEMLGLKKGKIEVGYDADFIELDENDNLLATYIL